MVTYYCASVCHFVYCFRVRLFTVCVAVLIQFFDRFVTALIRNFYHSLCNANGMGVTPTAMKNGNHACTNHPYATKVVFSIGAKIVTKVSIIPIHFQHLIITITIKSNQKSKNTTISSLKIAM